MAICKFGIRLSFGVLLIAIFIQGCATRVPVTKTKIVKEPELVLNQADSKPLIQKGLSIKIKPIHGKYVEQYPHFKGVLNFSGSKIVERYSYKYKQRMPVEESFSGSRNIPLFPLPAFEVLVTNNTNHVIKFSNATIALEDSNGNLYDPIDKESMIPYLKEAIRVNFRQDFPLGSNVRAHNEDQLFADQKQVKLIGNYSPPPAKNS